MHVCNEMTGEIGNFIAFRPFQFPTHFPSLAICPSTRVKLGGCILDIELPWNKFKFAEMSSNLVETSYIPDTVNT